MWEYIKLNRVQIHFGLKWSSLLFTTLALIGFLWGRLHGQIPHLSLIIKTLLAAGVFFPLFCFSLGTLKEFLVFKRTNTIFQEYPFKELASNGFKKNYLFKESKWIFVQVQLIGSYDGCHIECEVDNYIFKFVALVNLKNLQKGFIEKLKREFGEKKFKLIG